MRARAPQMGSDQERAERAREESEDADAWELVLVAFDVIAVPPVEGALLPVALVARVVVDQLRELCIRARRLRDVRDALHDPLHLRVAQARVCVAPIVRRGADFRRNVAHRTVGLHTHTQALLVTTTPVLDERVRLRVRQEAVEEDNRRVVGNLFGLKLWEVRQNARENGGHLAGGQCLRVVLWHRASSQVFLTSVVERCAGAGAVLLHERRIPRALATTSPRLALSWLFPLIHGRRLHRLIRSFDGLCGLLGRA